MRVATRAWIPPNVDQHPDFRATEYFMELGLGACSVPDRENRIARLS
jgi:hypothetical protein